MLKNYIKIAFRNLMKYKFISFINLFGLTIGLTCCMLIVLYIVNELSFDKYHKNAEQVYRVTRLFKNAETGATNLNLSTIAPPFGPLLKNDFKEIKKLTRLLDNSPAVIKYGEKKFAEPGVFYADEHLFEVFDVDVISGNPAKALIDPFSVMLSEDVARKYFGNEDPMNKVIKLSNQFNLKVTGVYKAFPSNSHIHPAVMISFNTLKDTAVYGEQNLRTNWGNNSFFTYILTDKNFDPDKLIAQFPAFLDRHMEHGEGLKPTQWTSLGLQKLTDIHLRSHTDYEAEENGDIKRVWIFSAIGLFILLIACINYMNLSTARSVLRAKEIGIRKVVGAGRGELITQFLSESVLICAMATVMAFLLTWPALPLLNRLSGQQLNIDTLFSWQFIIPLLLVPFVIGIASGIYPALFLSSFLPVKVLKGVIKAGQRSISFRKVLVVLQFAISIVLIISTAVVFQQLGYMQKKNLGYDKDHIVTLNYVNDLTANYQAFKTDLLSNSNIKEAGRSSRIPTGRLLDAMDSQINRGDSLAPAKADIKFVCAEPEFFTTYGIKMAAGRNFSKDFSTDSGSFLVNESAVKVLQLKSNDEAIGKQFRYGGRNGALVGVVKDFHFESMHQPILPLIFFIPRNQTTYNAISVKVSGQNIPGALAHIENTWKKYLPETPYTYTFLDENYTKLYESEQKQGTIFTVFAFIAIFIACLGLFGLSAFAITQRIKEIGIRKVLGAGVGNIVTLLSMDFLKLVIIAAVIAFPVAWFAMNSWLEDFAYRIDIPLWIFILAAIAAGCIALFTISFQAVKAALSNPVKNLRTE